MNRGDLWVTQSGWTLHLTETCCGTHWQKAPRKQVKDHSSPAFFDSPEFKLCPKAERASSSQPPASTEGTK